uniref:Ras-GEF domain-containing protein n=1 Tax=Arcella intermedia TaxID=1963864 RepID=A0A6B2LA66_9EUKA
MEMIEEWMKLEGHCYNYSILHEVECFAQEFQKEDKYFRCSRIILEEVHKAKMKRHNLNHTSRFFLPIYCTIGVPPQKIISLFSPEDVAKQLTLIDFDYYKSIDPNELLGLKWLKEKTALYSPNIISLSSRNDLLCRWVATTILVNEPEARTELLAKFIEISQWLFEMKNYHSFMGIITSFNLSAITRLSLFQGLPKKHNDLLREFNIICNPNFQNIRERMKEQTLVPFMGVYLSDIIRLDEALPDYVDSNGTKMINIKKHKKIADRVNELLSFQDSKLEPIEQLEPLYSSLVVLPAFLDNKTLHKLSIEIEPTPLQLAVNEELA